MDSGCGVMDLCFRTPTGGLENPTMLVFLKITRVPRTVWRSTFPVRIQPDFFILSVIPILHHTVNESFGFSKSALS